MAKKFYITTAIHYVNDDPHIGHMYENVIADVIARHRRRMGDDVWFLTGTDEHGQKIERAAAKEGILPIELADRVVAHHHDLWKKLNISNDDFIRTTEGRHRGGVYELTNYASAVGFGSGDHASKAKFEHYWPADIHLVGKDIVRFHAVYWPAWLMAAGVELPKRVVGHGWWLRDNEKISKSLGNVVAPHNIIEDFGADPFRYFLLREMVFGQ